MENRIGATIVYELSVLLVHGRYKRDNNISIPALCHRDFNRERAAWCACGNREWLASFPPDLGNISKGAQTKISGASTVLHITVSENLNVWDAINRQLEKSETPKNVSFTSPHSSPREHFADGNGELPTCAPSHPSTPRVWLAGGATCGLFLNIGSVLNRSYAR